MFINRKWITCYLEQIFAIFGGIFESKCLMVFVYDDHTLDHNERFVIINHSCITQGNVLRYCLNFNFSLSPNNR